MKKKKGGSKHSERSPCVASSFGWKPHAVRNSIDRGGETTHHEKIRSLSKTILANFQETRGRSTPGKRPFDILKDCERTGLVRSRRI